MNEKQYTKTHAMMVAAALTGLITKTPVVTSKLSDESGMESLSNIRTGLAKSAVMYADAVMAELEDGEDTYSISDL